MTTALAPRIPLRSGFAPIMRLTVALLLALPAAARAETAIPDLPGAPPFHKNLRQELAKAVAAQPAGYEPRTQHKHKDGTARYTNRLALETSPYLLQHSHNPVNWYPWGEEAFAEARRLQRPILVSIGYSTCHWCHVMEEESFDDPTTAEELNGSFVAIKVDREARPDVDEIYMSALHAMGERGGWPLNVWLTPDGDPFYGGTYFPPLESRGRPAFRSLLTTLATAWNEQREQVTRAASRLRAGVSAQLSQSIGQTSRLPGADELERAVATLKGQLDPAWGGRQGRMKFPSGLPLPFLLRYHRRTGDTEALAAATLTLEKIAAGGIRDHAGGGFHRYATDSRWLVPHFEKMLYDNALLASAFIQAYQVTGREDFAEVTRETLDYLGREMSSPEGGFYSATDADSQGPDGEMEEGLYFTWTPAEIDAVLGPKRGALAKRAFGVTPSGHVEGRSVLHRPTPTSALAKSEGRTNPELEAQLADLLSELYAARQSRLPPGLDDKILAAWNGLAISAFAKAGFALDDPAYVKRARKAANFVLQKMRSQGKLHRVYRGGQATGPAFLDDYAFLTAGLLDLYEADPNPRWLREAIALQAQLDTHFADAGTGGYFTTSDFHEKMIVRSKPQTDGAVPSGNAVSAMNLLRLASYTEDSAYTDRAILLLSTIADRLEQGPSSMGAYLSATDYFLDKPFEIIIVGPPSGKGNRELLAPIRTTFAPNRMLAVVTEGEDAKRHAELIPLIGSKSALKNKATAYVCVERVCSYPTSDPAVLAEQIGAVNPLRSPAPPAPL